MMKVRIRWPRAARIAAIGVGCLLIIKALPGLLEPPDPPPLAADVGLPQVFERSGRADPAPRRRRRGKRNRAEAPSQRPRSRPAGLAGDGAGRGDRHRGGQPRRPTTETETGQPGVPTAAAPPPPTVPAPPVAVPPPAPAPPPVPTAGADGAAADEFGLP